jgi:hypothetical protein
LNIHTNRPITFWRKYLFATCDIHWLSYFWVDMPMFMNGVWTWLCIFPSCLMCPVPVHGLNLICLLICLFLTADCLYGFDF